MKWNKTLTAGKNFGGQFLSSLIGINLELRLMQWFFLNVLRHFFTNCYFAITYLQFTYNCYKKLILRQNWNNIPTRSNSWNHGFEFRTRYFTKHNTISKSKMLKWRYSLIFDSIPKGDKGKVLSSKRTKNTIVNNLRLH